MNSKSQLLGKYRTARNRIQLAYANLVLWCDPETPPNFSGIHSRLNEDFRIFPNILDLINDEQSMKIACEDMYMVAYRSALTDLFPQTKVYCHSSGQIDKLKAQPWFQFWRILRNCFAHDLIFNFNPDEKAILPITWSGVTIELQMNGKPLMLGKMPYKKMLELIETVEIFLTDEIS